MILSPIFAGLTPHHYAAIVADPSLTAEQRLFDKGPVHTRRQPSNLNERAALQRAQAR